MSELGLNARQTTFTCLGQLLGLRLVVYADLRARPSRLASVGMVGGQSPAILVEGLGAARLPRQIIDSFLAGKLLLYQLLLAVLFLTIQVLQHTLVILKVLVIVLYYDACGLKNVPSVIDTPP